jgi:hypothetical protein
MTGYQSKKAAALDKLLDDDDIQVYKRPWVGLTDEERREIMRYEKDFWGVSGWEWKCMEALEAKLKEKNT